MSKGAQCRKAACQNAGVRIDQGAVEVQKNGASHDPKIAAKSTEYKFVWFRFCFGSIADCEEAGYALREIGCGK
jgi:hypothetical protein